MGRMIIDGHAYCFPARHEPAGFDSAEDRWAEFQRELGGHHQPAWRVRDRTPAGNDTLVDPETGELRGVKFSVHRNRFTWEYEGEVYTKQYYPPMLYRMECPPELLTTEMDYAGIDMAVLHTSPQLGRLNDYLSEAGQAYPDRIRWLISLDEGRIPDDPEAAVAEIERWAKFPEACGYQFMPKFYYLGGHNGPWDSGAMRAFWDGFASIGLTAYFTPLGARPDTRYTAAERDTYMEEHDILARWMERYPDVTVVVTHGFPWRSYVEGDRIVLPERIWDIFEAPQCHLQLLIPIQLGNLWEYPWLEVEPTIQACVQRIGAERLIYGTDMPMVAQFCTYRQTLDQYRRHCSFLSDAERAAITGGTAAKVLGLDAE